MSFISRYIGHSCLLKPLSKIRSRRIAIYDLLKYADTQIPFYKGRYSEFLNDAQSLNDAGFFNAFSRTPITTKQDLKNQNTAFLAPSLSSKKAIFDGANDNIGHTINTLHTIFIKKNFIIPISTGGTSGTPAYRWLDHHDANVMAQSFLESFHLNGWNRGDGFVLYYPLQSYFTGTYAAFNDWLHRIFGFSVVPFQDINLESVKELLQTLESRKARLLVIFPCVLQRVAEIMREYSLEPFKGLTSINVSGEFFFDCSKSFITEMFPNARIEMTYGAVEIGEIAHQHESSSFDYKVFDQYAYVEQGDNNTILVTSLRQKAFPMIRYEMEDKANIVTRPNAQQYMLELEGKNTDYILGSDGHKYYASFFNRFINTINPVCGHNIIHFRIRHDGTTAKLSYVIKDNSTNIQTIIERETMQMMRLKFPQFHSIRVDFPKHFEHDYTRKFKIIAEGDGLSEVVGGYYKKKVS